MSERPDAPELSSVSAEPWDQARRFLPVIRRLTHNAARTRTDVVAAARELQCSPSQVYVLLQRYAADPRLTSLLPRRRGPPPGTSRVASEIDTLVDEVIDSVYLTRQKPKIMDVVTEVRRRCHGVCLRAPGRKAITARLQAKPAYQVTARREGRSAARDQFAPAIGSLEASWPLSLVQIDHTLVDIIIVDSVTRAPIQRPWLTIAIDVHSRCVAGFHLSLEPPSATSVALCIAHAVLPKEGWLAKRGIEGDWPVQGLCARLHLDNAKEFHSEALRRGCEQYGIAIDYRPVKTPHYGGHIERLIGTVMGKVHLLPGTTFADIRAKGDLDPSKTAVMTLDEFERWLGHTIAGVYHRGLHRSLGTTPVAAWTRGVLGDAHTLGRGAAVAVTDPRRFLIDFLPIERRLVRREGVALHSIAYWSDVLTTWIGEKQKMIVRYDPRDLSRIYLLAPDGQYYDLVYRDLRRPPISLWEHRLALKRLRTEGHTQLDESAIFRTIECMRRIADDASTSSKAARRQRERRLRLVNGARAEEPSHPETRASDTEPLRPLAELFIVEEWS